MSSFAITFGIAETGIMQGIAQNVSLICRDEMLHARGGAEVLKIEIKKNPALFERLAPQIKMLFDAVLETEMKWTDYLFSEGRQVVGVNPKLIKEYVNYMAQPVARTLGIEVPLIEENPLPYMENYIDSSKVQMAAQEIQLTSYLVNSVLAPTDMAGRLAQRPFRAGTQRSRYRSPQGPDHRVETDVVLPRSCSHHHRQRANAMYRSGFAHRCLWDSCHVRR
jgi:hypothetical protein